MRNSWLHQRVADYVPWQQLRSMRAQGVRMDRDLAFMAEADLPTMTAEEAEGLRQASKDKRTITITQLSVRPPVKVVNTSQTRIANCSPSLNGRLSSSKSFFHLRSASLDLRSPKKPLTQPPHLLLSMSLRLAPPLLPRHKYTVLYPSPTSRKKFRKLWQRMMKHRVCKSQMRTSGSLSKRTSLGGRSWKFRTGSSTLASMRSRCKCAD